MFKANIIFFAVSLQTICRVYLEDVMLFLCVPVLLHVYHSGSAYQGYLYAIWIKAKELAEEARLMLVRMITNFRTATMHLYSMSILSSKHSCHLFRS